MKLNDYRGLPPRRGFNALELLVVIGIFVILLSIFVPYLLKLLEDNRRVRCANNLAQLFGALSSYAHYNNGDYPRVVYDAAGNPNGYTCYTGADGGDPFARNSSVKSNDVTASLWLLVRLRLAKPASYICPSTPDEPDEVGENVGDIAARGNFRGPVNLSYSYASPFSAAPGYRLNDTRRADFALMADKNPGASGDQSNAAGPPANALPLQLSIANSNNHGKAGQNILYADGHVSAYLQATPYCGISDEIHPELHDNIYTALAARPIERNHYIPKYGNGFLGNNVAPAWDFDSYLVPTSTDNPPAPAVVLASQPTSRPVTQPISKAATNPTTIPVQPIPTSMPTINQSATISTTTQQIETRSPATAPSPRPTTKP